jgi:hypothetical protein
MEIICECCHQAISLNLVTGAAGVTSEGVFIGKCPWCGHKHEDHTSSLLSAATFTEESVEGLVTALEMAGDDLCQRVVDLLWERGWRVSQMDEIPSQMSNGFKKETGVLQ